MAGIALLLFACASFAVGCGRRSPLNGEPTCFLRVAVSAVKYCLCLYFCCEYVLTSAVCLSIRLRSNFGESCEGDGLYHVLYMTSRLLDIGHVAMRVLSVLSHLSRTDFTVYGSDALSLNFSVSVCQHTAALVRVARETVWSHCPQL